MPAQVKFYIPPKLEQQLLKRFECCPMEEFQWEIWRRENEPTDIEQVEDCLDSLVDNVCLQIEQEKQEKVAREIRDENVLLARERRLTRSTYHPTAIGMVLMLFYFVRFILFLLLLSLIASSTPGYKMKPLKMIENEDGETTRLVSDAEFTDMIISVTGE